MQKTLARELTTMVHGEEQLQTAEDATQILFGAGTSETLAKLDEQTFLAVFEGVPMFEVERAEIEKGVNILELICTLSKVFPSKGEARRMVEGGGLGLNKNKVASIEVTVSASDLINGKYLLVQKGKKNYVLIKVI
jgi:tyrosyl-tRNA synthetase